MAKLVNMTFACGVSVPNTNLYVWHLGYEYDSKRDIRIFPCGEKANWVKLDLIANIDAGAICRECLRHYGLEAIVNPPAVTKEFMMLQNRVESLERRLSQLTEKAGSDGNR